ncbi:MAG: hypothetical protein ACTHKQ_05660 [Mesorhizobium sp.]
MTGESDNLPAGGTDTALQSLTLDDAANIDFRDPDEDTEEVEQDQQSEEVTDEADDSQEADETTAEEDDETETEDEGTADEADKPEPEDDVTVTVNGERLALSALKAGYMRQADYTRKTQAVSTKEKSLDALTARVNQSVDAIADFLSKQIPEAPDPSLAWSNPAEFVQRKAMHEAAMSQVNAILSQAGEVKEVGNTLTAEKRAELLRSENALLAEAFPQTKIAESRKKFFDNAYGAASELGWTESEMKGVTDHRMFKLAHYAALGLKAEKAAQKAKQKVLNVPPVTPQKRPQGANAAKVAKNKDAMKRLARSGSIEDAMSIDFE